EIQADGGGAGVEPVQVRVEEQQAAAMQPQTLPDAVPQHEAGVEHRHLRLVARDQRAVQIDPQVRVARIGREILASGHRLLPGGHPRAAPARGEEPPAVWRVGQAMSAETIRLTSAILAGLVLMLILVLLGAALAAAVVAALAASAIVWIRRTAVKRAMPRAQRPPGCIPAYSGLASFGRPPAPA